MFQHRRFLLILLLLLLTGCGGVTEPEATETTGPETAAPAPLLSPSQEPPPEPEAEKLRLTLAIRGRTATQLRSNLDDDEPYTYVNLGASPLKLESVSGEAIHTLYVSFLDQPWDYELLYPDGSVQTVSNPMLHQTVRLEQPAAGLEIRTPAKVTNHLCELSAYGEGRLPPEVQDWQWMEDGAADLCLFPAHADDEYVMFGGVIPYYAGELGCKVQLCWMTHHRLEPVRNHELLNALWTAGCVYYPQIQYEATDVMVKSYAAALQYYSFEDWEAYQVEMIRKYRPLVVLSHDEKGEYGHGAHILAAMTLEQAVVDAADSGSFPDSAGKYGTWDVPKTYLHLYGRAEERTVMDFGKPLSHFDGMTMYDVAAKCYRCHESQYYGTTFRVYRNGTAYAAISFGLYRSTVGPDSDKNDLLENVDPNTAATAKQPGSSHRYTVPDDWAIPLSYGSPIEKSRATNHSPLCSCLRGLFCSPVSLFSLPKR